MVMWQKGCERSGGYLGALLSLPYAVLLLKSVVPEVQRQPVLLFYS